MKPGITNEQADDLRDFIAAFATERAKRRLLALIETRKGRQTIMSGLDHVSWLDPRSAVLVPFGSQTADHIERMLLARGAPEVCRILSTDPELNGTGTSLKKALSMVVAGGSGAVVLCIPGRLAYYESEEPRERYVCCK